MRIQSSHSDAPPPPDISFIILYRGCKNVHSPFSRAGSGASAASFKKSTPLLDDPVDVPRTTSAHEEVSLPQSAKEEKVFLLTDPAITTPSLVFRPFSLSHVASGALWRVGGLLSTSSSSARVDYGMVTSSLHLLQH